MWANCFPIETNMRAFFCKSSWKLSFSKYLKFCSFIIKNDSSNKSMLSLLKYFHTVDCGWELALQPCFLLLLHVWVSQRLQVISQRLVFNNAQWLWKSTLLWNLLHLHYPQCSSTYHIYVWWLCVCVRSCWCNLEPLTLSQRWEALFFQTPHPEVFFFFHFFKTRLQTRPADLSDFVQLPLKPLTHTQHCSLRSKKNGLWCVK